MDSIDDFFVKILFDKNNTIKFIVKGTSMLPSYKSNDIVLIKKQSNYSLGDIVVFKYDNNLFMHRIIKKHRNNYILKGDNSNQIEKTFISNIYGKVIQDKSNYVHSFIIRIFCMFSYLFYKHQKNQLIKKIYISFRECLFNKRKVK